jgi:hypothetical protein
MPERRDRRRGIDDSAAARRVLNDLAMNTFASRTAFALVSIFAASGCALAGDRVGGVCPTGEVCSAEAPNGLFFLGARRSDSFGGGVEITAVGGTQTIKVLEDSNTDSPAFDRAFDASTSDVTVAAISAVAPPNVTISGEADGTTSLRLLESGTDKLLDRVDVHVAAIDSVAAFPQELFLVASDDGTPWALLSGGKASLVVQLKSKGGDRLVDEELTMTSDFGKATSQAWDLFEITAPTSGDASYTVTAGKGSFPVKASVVAAVDKIESSKVLNELGADGQLEAMKDQLLCFIGTSGSARVAGAEWKFTGSSSITITPVDATVSSQTSCVQIKGTAVGPAKLTVEASGFSRVVDINFVKKAARGAHGTDKELATRPFVSASAGERAGGN